MTGDPDLTVVLSTYNGEKYLRPLLESVLSQPAVSRLLIRDDGSCDGTKSILTEYAARPGVQVELGENMGVPGSYWALVPAAAVHGGFVAFCDQDDLWLPDKMSRALGILTEQIPAGTPGLYCSTYLVTDQDLNVLRKERLPRRVPSFHNALVENVVTGCTVVLNPAAVSLIASYTPKCARMHDWWMYLVISALGTVVFDDHPALYYRQHGANAVGQPGGLLSHYRDRMRRFLHGEGVLVRTNQAREFRQAYGSLLDPDKRRVLDGFLDSRGDSVTRIRYALFAPVRRQTLFEDALLRLMILLDRV